ncbi:MAG: hypothetical protein Q8R55_01335 [Candidatus Taylorbacteria bacterium]|nr:hypothetical protein [Candidatus Taylorbacteria bacterium]
MVQLETVEDFEKVKKALEDAKSTPRDYCVCPYSYCQRCNEVREFEAPAVESLGELIRVKCMGCGDYFLISKLRDKNNIFWGFQSSYVFSSEHGAEMTKLNSREMQFKFFAVALEKRITKEKSELRTVQDRIQKFARFRS